MRGRQPEGVVHHESDGMSDCREGRDGGRRSPARTTTEARPRRHRCNPISALLRTPPYESGTGTPTRSKSSRRNAIRQPQMNGTSRGWQPPERSQRIPSCGSRQGLEALSSCAAVVDLGDRRGRAAHLAVGERCIERLQPAVRRIDMGVGEHEYVTASLAGAGVASTGYPPRARCSTTRAAAFGRLCSAATLPSVDQSSTTMTSISSVTAGRIW